jgi:hypothetical protein
MNHTEAVSTGAVERYLLGQLSAPESDEFEQHFFDCTECARDLRAGALFEDNARSVFLGERPAAKPVPDQAAKPAEDPGRARPRIWRWFGWRPWSVAPALASVVLAAIAAYQAWIVIPGLRGQLHEVMAPQAVASHALPPLARGDTRVLEVPRGSRFYTIYMDPDWQGFFAGYLCSIQDVSGSAKFSLRLSAPAPGEPIQILMARSLLPSGRYTVVIRGIAEGGQLEAELARYSLILKLD